MFFLFLLWLPGKVPIMAFLSDIGRVYWLMGDKTFQMIVHDQAGRTTLFSFHFISIPQGKRNINIGKKITIEITNLKVKDIVCIKY